MSEIISAARFRVEITGIIEGPFLSVSPIESFSAAIETRSGIDQGVRKTPGGLGATDVTLRRLYDGGAALFEWRRNIERGVIDRRSGSVIALDADLQQERARFNFFGSWPRRWRVGPWDAGDDQPLVEEVTLCVDRVELATG